MVSISLRGIPDDINDNLSKRRIELKIKNKEEMIIYILRKYFEKYELKRRNEYEKKGIQKA